MLNASMVKAAGLGIALTVNVPDRPLVVTVKVPAVSLTVVNVISLLIPPTSVTA